MSDLLAEFTAAAGMTFEDRSFDDWLIRQGVPATVLRGSGPWLRGPAIVGAAPIETFRDGTYQPAPDGKFAFVMAANQYGDDFFLEAIDDLIAWLPSDPSRWWRRHGVATFLNEQAVDRARCCDESAHLHETPLDWLRVGCRGAVVIDQAAPLRFALTGLTVVCASRALAEQLERQCRLVDPAMPSIMLRATRETAVAA